jgi:hypothetical protein
MPQPHSNSTIRVEFPGRVFVYIERDTDLQLLRSVVEMLRA